MPRTIETVSLTRVFGGRVPVNAVDLSVDAGELFALVGPSGAGKTTLVRMLATLLRPSSGSARVAGFDVATVPP